MTIVILNVFVLPEISLDSVSPLKFTPKGLAAQPVSAPERQDQDKEGPFVTPTKKR